MVHVDAALGEKRNPGNADGTSTHCLNPRLGFIRPRSPSSRDPSMQHRRARLEQEMRHVTWGARISVCFCSLVSTEAPTALPTS